MMENNEPEQTQPLIVRTYGPGLRCGERYAAPARFIDAAECDDAWRDALGRYIAARYAERKGRAA